LVNSVNNIVVLFDKTVKLLLSIMICAKTKSSVKLLRSEFCNKHWYLASISGMLEHIDNDEICHKNVVANVLGQEYLHAVIKQVEEMLNVKVIKAFVKFMIVGLCHDGHV